MIHPNVTEAVHYFAMLRVVAPLAVALCVSVFLYFRFTRDKEKGLKLRRAIAT